MLPANGTLTLKAEGRIPVPINTPVAYATWQQGLLAGSWGPSFQVK
jgi:hypothetical protein